MKNKGALVVVIVIGFLAIAVFLLWQNKDSVQEPNRSPSQDSTIVPTDYSVLEKDRLYTEEEGRYENLSEAGQGLLRTVLALPECTNDPTLSYCYDHQQAITRSSIVSLKDKFLLLSFPTVKGPRYAVYDLEYGEPVNNGAVISGNSMRNAKAIIFIQEKDVLYYKPGMNGVKRVEGSALQGSHTYAELYGFVNTIDVSFIDDNSIRASVFDDNQLLPEEPYKERLHKKIGEKVLIIE